MGSSEQNAGPATEAFEAPVVPADKPVVTAVPVDRTVLEQLVGGTFHDPHQVLGPHLGEDDAHPFHEGAPGHRVGQLEGALPVSARHARIVGTGARSAVGPPG